MLSNDLFRDLKTTKCCLRFISLFKLVQFFQLDMSNDTTNSIIPVENCIVAIHRLESVLNQYSVMFLNFSFVRPIITNIEFLWYITD